MNLDKALVGLLFMEEVIDAVEAYRHNPTLVNRALIIQAVLEAYKQMETQNETGNDPQPVQE